MEKTKIYDLPTRLFHGLFALGFIGAYSIGNFIDDDSALFSYHMLIGLTLGGLVLLRIVWGLIGSRYARFNSFPLHPTKLIRYFTSMFSSNPQRDTGHNPASSWAALMMMGLALMMVITGLSMVTNTGGEVFEEIHEIAANTFLIVVIAHILGVLFHQFRHRDQIGLSMIHGYKQLEPNQAGIPHFYLVPGILFILLVGSWIVYLGKNYQPSTQTLQLMGTQLHLAESENESSDSFQAEDDD